jgi:hypothetical protein
MRYLFFIFVVIFSSQAFSQGHPSCPTIIFKGCYYSNHVASNYSGCLAQQGTLSQGGNCSHIAPDAVYLQCGKSCSCPEGQKLNTVRNANGQYITSCIPDEPDVPPEDECPEGDKVYDPVSGTLVCPGSGDGSSSSASSRCVVPGDFNNDCIPDDQASSAANSSAPTSAPPNTSSPSTGSSGSNTSGGSGSGPGSGGGSGDGTGGGNSGGGSASSAASAGGGSGGSNSSWTPVSGYGNWIPVNPNSPCPNKYQDRDGQWWCWGGQSDSNSSGTGGASSGAAKSSGANSSGSGYSAGECDSEPVCPVNEPACLQLVQQWHIRCGGEKLDNKIFELPEEGEGDEIGFGASLTRFKTELEKLVNVQVITQFFEFNASGSCPVWQVNVWVFDVVIDQQCSPDIPWDWIAGIIIAVACLVAVRIALG